MAKQKLGGLGKGLDALFADNGGGDDRATVISISEIEPNTGQPRRDFDESALSDLADSIREHGVLQPILVRPLPGGGYQIVAGERRWRASRMAGLSELPAVIRDLSDSETLELALIENLQREDLNPVEMAMGYQTLIDEYGLTQEQISKRVGKSRPAVANTLRLLGLPGEVLEQVKTGDITQGHARALLALEDRESMLTVAKEIVKGNLLVRDIEKMARKAKTAPKKEKAAAEASGWGDSLCMELELALGQELGTGVRVFRNLKGYSIKIDAYSREELERIGALLQKKG